MTKTVGYEPFVALSELVNILRWEDDGGATFERYRSISKLEKENNSRSINDNEDDLLHDELKDYSFKGGKE